MRMRIVVDGRGGGAAGARSGEWLVDNQAAIASAYNPEHHGKLKHVERRHFYIREAIEAHRLCVPCKIMNITSPVMNMTSPNAS